MSAHAHHVTPLATLFATFGALVALTVLTSAMAYVNLDELIGISGVDIWVTLGIATVKAALVALIFMHLVHDKAFNGLILLFTLGFAALFISFALMDTGQYEDQIDQYIEDKQQQEIAETPAA
ncbi:MAG: cytochrome C oxidase subunit IV family protein [Planctomycetota bacterium]